MQTAVSADTGPARRSPFRPGRVIHVTFTGVQKSKSRWVTLFNPPMERAMAVIADDLGRHPSRMAVLATVAEREPPILREALVLVSAGEGEGRWPLAYLSAENEPLTLDEARAALARIGGGQ
jgi:hypothetical protein